MNISYREAKPSDLSNIQSLNNKLFQKECSEYDKTLRCNWTFGEGASFIRKRIEEAVGFAWVAQEGRDVIGCLVGGIRALPSFRGGTKIGALEFMWVDPHYRGKGIGTELASRFLRWCKEQKLDRSKVELYAQNKDALRFYKRMGYEDFFITMEKNI